MLKKALIVTAALLAGFVIACGSTPAKPDAKPSVTAPATVTPPTATPPVATPPAATAAAAAAQPTTPAAPSLTNAQKQAIGKAQDYLKFTAFSRKGLIKQLEYEGFATADATFAVDLLTVDWNAQAAAKGKSYLDIQHFSRKGLIDQLKYEGFTDAQAAYGATTNGL